MGLQQLFDTSSRDGISLTRNVEVASQLFRQAFLNRFEENQFYIRRYMAHHELRLDRFYLQCPTWRGSAPRIARLFRIIQRTAAGHRRGERIARPGHRPIADRLSDEKYPGTWPLRLATV